MKSWQIETSAWTISISVRDGVGSILSNVCDVEESEARRAAFDGMESMLLSMAVAGLLPDDPAVLIPVIQEVITAIDNTWEY